MKFTKPVNTMPQNPVMSPEVASQRNNIVNKEAEEGLNN